MSTFHFLRPEYLLFLLPAWGLVFWLLKQQNDTHKWQKIIEPKLLKHLLVNDESSVSKTRIAVPWHLALFLTLLILALSGPSWKLKASPFSQDETKVAFLMYVGESMLSTDIMPSRLSRATIKMEELLGNRNDLHALLLAYSGTAHLVLPLTGDHEILKTFAQALDPTIMPLKGNNIQSALLLAQKSLKSKAGSLVVITDAISASSVKLAVKNGLKKEHNIILWQMASTQLSSVSDFKRAASVLGADYVPYSANNEDVSKVLSLIETNFKNAAQEDNSRYEDGGYMLIPLLFLLLLFWARQGFMAELWRRE